MSRFKILSAFTVLIIILALPITLFLVRQTQDNRSSAAAPDKLEAEGGVLGGNAIAQPDSQASGGNFIRFGANTQTQTPIPTVPSESVKAFPGAEGWGANTKGGRGGTIIEVTNINDSGAGSFRNAVTASGSRIVVFRTGGTITLLSPINVSNPNLTIAGQTAPGGGITIKGGSFIISANEVIIRGMRFRNGTTSSSTQMWDTLGIYGSNSSNIIFDHNSISWGIDESLTTNGNINNTTFSWNIVSESLLNAQHDKGPHSMGVLLGGGANSISVHHNLLAHNNQRNVRVQGNAPLEVVNNIVYNWGEWGMQVDQNPYSVPTLDPKLNIISNYYKAGPNSNTGRTIRLTGPFTGSQLVYVSGNFTPQRTTSSQAEWLAITDGSTRTQLERLTPWPMSSNPVTVTAYPAFTNNIYQCAGAVTSRDAVDTRIVQNAQNGTGSIIDSPNQVGGWPTLAAGTSPTDTDHDGMPDSWETSHGLNPINAADRNNTASSGYTWVEEYINSLFPTTCP